MYQRIVKEYIKQNEGEKGDLAAVCEQFDITSEKSLIDRKNAVGHFTASAFVICQKTNAVMMVYHNFLKKYLQPGGHIEAVDINPLIAAKREIVEETGVDVEQLVYHHAASQNELVPFNISVHDIPENRAKEEGPHQHYDLQYLFSCAEELAVDIDTHEVSGCEWIAWNSFKSMPEYQTIAQKIKDML